MMGDVQIYDGTSAEVIIELIGWNLNFSDSSSKEFLKKIKL